MIKFHYVIHVLRTRNYLLLAVAVTESKHYYTFLSSETNKIAFNSTV